MYSGGAGGLGWWFCGGVQHQRPNILHQCRKHSAADQRDTYWELQRVRAPLNRELHFWEAWCKAKPFVSPCSTSVSLKKRVEITLFSYFFVLCWTAQWDGETDWVNGRVISIRVRFVTHAQRGKACIFSISQTDWARAWIWATHIYQTVIDKNISVRQWEWA